MDENINSGCPAWAKSSLDKILDAYHNHFDIQTQPELSGKKLAAMASFHSRGEKYVLTKKAKLWAVECNEHVLFFTIPHLTAEDVSEITELIINSEPELVSPHSEHMYTYLSAVIITEKADEDAKKALKQFRFRKNYRFSLHGWCHIRMAVYETEGCIFTNYDGKELKKMLQRILSEP